MQRSSRKGRPRPLPLAPGDAVWVRLAGYPPWPARILAPGWAGTPPPRPRTLWVMFFNDSGQMANVQRATVHRFCPGDRESQRGTRNPCFGARIAGACAEAEAYQREWRARKPGGLMEQGLRSDTPTDEMVPEMDRPPASVFDRCNLEEARDMRYNDMGVDSGGSEGKVEGGNKGKGVAERKANAKGNAQANGDRSGQDANTNAHAAVTGKRFGMDAGLGPEVLSGNDAMKCVLPAAGSKSAERPAAPLDGSPGDAATAAAIASPPNQGTRLQRSDHSSVGAERIVQPENSSHGTVQFSVRSRAEGGGEGKCPRPVQALAAADARRGILSPGSRQFQGAGNASAAAIASEAENRAVGVFGTDCDPGRNPPRGDFCAAANTTKATYGSRTRAPEVNEQVEKIPIVRRLAALEGDTSCDVQDASASKPAVQLGGHEEAPVSREMQEEMRGGIEDSGCGVQAREESVDQSRQEVEETKLLGKGVAWRAADGNAWYSEANSGSPVLLGVGVFWRENDGSWWFRQVSASRKKREELQGMDLRAVQNSVVPNQSCPVSPYVPQERVGKPQPQKSIQSVPSVQTVVAREEITPAGISAHAHVVPQSFSPAVLQSPSAALPRVESAHEKPASSSRWPSQQLWTPQTMQETLPLSSKPPVEQQAEVQDTRGDHLRLHSQIPVSDVVSTALDPLRWSVARFMERARQLCHVCMAKNGHGASAETQNKHDVRPLTDPLILPFSETVWMACKALRSHRVPSKDIDAVMNGIAELGALLANDPHGFCIAPSIDDICAGWFQARAKLGLPKKSPLPAKKIGVHAWMESSSGALVPCLAGDPVGHGTSKVALPRTSTKVLEVDRRYLSVVEGTPKPSTGLAQGGNGETGTLPIEAQNASARDVESCGPYAVLPLPPELTQNGASLVTDKVAVENADFGKDEQRPRSFDRDGSFELGQATQQTRDVVAVDRRQKKRNDILDAPLSGPQTIGRISLPGQSHQGGFGPIEKDLPLASASRVEADGCQGPPSGVYAAHCCGNGGASEAEPVSADAVHRGGRIPPVDVALSRSTTRPDDLNIDATSSILDANSVSLGPTTEPGMIGSTPPEHVGLAAQCRDKIAPAGMSRGSDVVRTGSAPATASTPAIASSEIADVDAGQLSNHRMNLPIADRGEAGSRQRNQFDDARTLGGNDAAVNVAPSLSIQERANAEKIATTGTSELKELSRMDLEMLVQEMQAEKAEWQIANKELATLAEQQQDELESHAIALSGDRARKRQRLERDQGFCSLQ